MSTNSHKINLIQTTSTLPLEVLSLVRKIRTIAIGTTIVFLLVTACLFGYAFFLHKTYDSFQKEKSDLTDALTIVTTREGLYRILKKHIGITGSIMKSQVPWGVVLDTIEEISGPPFLTSIAVTDSQEVTVSYLSESVEESMTLMENIAQELSQKKIRNPILLSYTLGKNGGVQFTVSFFPVF